jgi:hypothetical protein
LADGDQILLLQRSLKQLVWLTVVGLGGSEAIHPAVVVNGVEMIRGDHLVDRKRSLFPRAQRMLDPRVARRSTSRKADSGEVVTRRVIAELLASPDLPLSSLALMLAASKGRWRPH